MSIDLLNTNNISNLQLTVVDDRGSLLFCKNNSSILNSINNLLINSLIQNPSLAKSQVICLSDWHHDKQQKYIRANIVNEILASRNKIFKPVIFLVEGIQAGYEANDWVYDRQIGKNLYRFPHRVFGWDDMELNITGMKLVKKYQVLLHEKLTIEENISKLDQKQKVIMRDTSLDIDTILNKVDQIEEKRKLLYKTYAKLVKESDIIFSKIHELAIERNEFLYKSIQKAVKICPEATIFVIGGEFHFKYIFDRIHHISCSILNIKNTRLNVDIEEAFNEVYGAMPSTKNKIEEVHEEV